MPRDFAAISEGFAMQKTLLAAAAAFTLVGAGGAKAVPVDLELMFLNDVSGSITASDFAFQLAGYASAFRDSDLIEQIQDGAIGRIAVSIGFFADTVSQAIPFTIIEDAASGEAFAQLVESIARPSVGINDGLDTAIDFAAASFGDNGFEGARLVIDVVTEGADSGCGFSTFVCTDVQGARDDALAAGVDQINALLLDDRDFFGNDPADIIDAVGYAETNIIGGTGSFAVFEEDFTGFASAISAKIAREVRPDPEVPPVPLPAAGWLMLAALGGVGALRRR